MEALHKLDLRGKTNGNWPGYHKEFINIWEHRVKFLPIRKPFFLLDTMACLEYMHWFRVADKPYLLLVEARSRQLHQKRHDDCLSNVSLEEVSQRVCPHLQPNKWHRCTFSKALLSPTYYAWTPMATPIPLSMLTLIPTSMSMYLGFVTLYGYSPIVLQTPNA
ncbi:hypothetical protein Goari_005085 [Gossypium aridum]|uniref:Uncharacterized protein n=1 Tax=Gossypium aridum TaxID=34290 RepID=A0A7J8Y6Y9_GOSAI|nr:hypothetical protein [Gossypium aridum]